MKIAFLNKYQGKVYRGAETFVAELSKRLSKNHDVDIIIRVSYFDLLKKRYDLIIPTNGRFQVFATRLMTWLTRGKMVVSGQSGAGFDDRLNLYAFPNAFVALSEYQKTWAKRVNPFVRVLKIPNGVTLKELKTNARRGEKVVLSVGAFTKEKRHDLTIRAVAKLPGVKLIIVGGGGDLREDIKSLGRKLLGERFEVKTLPYERMAEVYGAASVLAFPSVPWESFGVVLVEAMASGIPVVAMDDPIRREIVGEGGILVDLENTDEYAQALLKAMKEEWGSRPRLQAEKFDWDKIAKKYEELIEEVATKK